MKRNILLMIADDLGRMAGCYGENTIATPSIDRFAESGIRFDMAFTSTASCSASRSVIYTGRHTHETGQYGLHHDYHHFQTFSHIPTAPAMLGEAGYHCGIIGKVHVGPEAVYPWAERRESASRDVAWVAQQADDYLQQRRADNRAFFLTIGFIDPHRDATRGGFGNDTIVEGIADRLFTDDEVTVPPFLPDIPEVRRELAAYYRSVYRLDQGVGLVLQALERSGFGQDTLVCFLSDNGSPFLNSKTTLYDAGVHLPLILRIPGYGNGIANPNLVSFVDLLPTFLDWAEYTDSNAIRALKGRSLLGIAERTTLQPDWQQVFGSHTFHEITNYWPTRFLRTPRFKYHRNVAWQLDFPFSGDLYGSLSWEGIRNREPVYIGQRSLRNYVRRPPEELYDLLADPAEVNNLAGDPAFGDELLDLRSRMERWQQETDDPWLYRDGISVRAVRHHLDAGLQMPERYDMDIDKPGNRA